MAQLYSFPRQQHYLHRIFDNDLSLTIHMNFLCHIISFLICVFFNLFFILKEYKYKKIVLNKK